MKTFIQISLLVAGAASSCGVNHDQKNSSQVASVGQPVTSSDLRIAQYCHAYAVKKLSKRISPCAIDASAIKATYIDNRWYNPSAYVWYEGKASCDTSMEKNMKVMVQYYQGECI